MSDIEKGKNLRQSKDHANTIRRAVRLAQYGQFSHFAAIDPDISFAIQDDKGDFPSVPMKKSDIVMWLGNDVHFDVTGPKPDEPVFRLNMSNLDAIVPAAVQSEQDRLQ